jgi:hypothetical protein
MARPLRYSTRLPSVCTASCAPGLLARARRMFPPKEKWADPPTGAAKSNQDADVAKQENQRDSRGDQKLARGTDAEKRQRWCAGVGGRLTRRRRSRASRSRARRRALEVIAHHPVHPLSPSPSIPTANLPNWRSDGPDDAARGRRLEPSCSSGVRGRRARVPALRGIDARPLFHRRRTHRAAQDLKVSRAECESILRMMASHLEITFRNFLPKQG